MKEKERETKKKDKGKKIISDYISTHIHMYHLIDVRTIYDQGRKKWIQRRIYSTI